MDENTFVKAIWAGISSNDALSSPARTKRLLYVYMRPGRSQTGMIIEIVKMFTWDLYENHKIFNLFPLPGNFLFRWLLLACVVPMSMLQPRPVWNVGICIYIHLKSELIPVWSQSARSSRWNDFRPVWVIFVSISCKHLLLIILWPKRNGRDWTSFRSRHRSHVNGALSISRTLCACVGSDDNEKASNL
jgi:hypothetical protein